MTNPFESPQPVAQPGIAPEIGSGQPKRSGLIRHVPVVAIFMMIHGAIVALLGVGMLGMAIFLPHFMREAMREGMQEAIRQQEEEGGEEIAQQMQEATDQMTVVMGVTYGVMGTGFLLCGGLSVFAGARNLGYRNRVLGIVALAIGFVPVFTCWCAPTAIGVGVYGLIVLLNSDVAIAFQLREQGCTTDQIKYGDW